MNHSQMHDKTTWKQGRENTLVIFFCFSTASDCSADCSKASPVTAKDPKFHVTVRIGTGIAQLVVCWACCSVWWGIAASILLWVSGTGDFPLELTWVLSAFLQNSFGWEYKPRSSLCTRAVHRMDSNDPDIHVLDGWMLATKTQPACTIHKDGMQLTHWLD